MFTSLWAAVKSNAKFILVIAALLAIIYFLRNDIKILRLELEIVNSTLVTQKATITRLEKQNQVDVDTALNFRLGTGIITKEHQAVEDTRNKEVEAVQNDTTKSDQEKRSAVDRIEMKSIWNSYCLVASSPACPGGTP